MLKVYKCIINHLFIVYKWLFILVQCWKFSYIYISIYRVRCVTIYRARCVTIRLYLKFERSSSRLWNIVLFHSTQKLKLSQPWGNFEGAGYVFSNWARFFFHEKQNSDFFFGPEKLAIFLQIVHLELQC